MFQPEISPPRNPREREFDKILTREKENLNETKKRIREMRKGEEEDDIFGEKFTDDPETSKNLSKI